MNCNNLIRLGACAQDLYDMKEDFKIMFVPEDSPLIIKLAAKNEYLETGIDTIRLHRIGSTDNYEMGYIGYSHLTNTLVVRS